MKNVLIILSIMLIMVSGAYAVSIGSGVGIDIEVEEFAPLLWMCDSRVVYDDNVEPGRISDGGDELVERINNYAFEGEQIEWVVLAMDKNKIDQNIDVFVSIGPFNDARRMVPYTYYDQSCLADCQDDLVACGQDCNADCFINATQTLNQTCYTPCSNACQAAKPACDASCLRNGLRLEANDIQANCVRIGCQQDLMSSCNARIEEEYIRECDEDFMDMFRCTFTVETPTSMYGEYWVTLEAEDGSGLYTHADEVEYWFLNPVIALSIQGDLVFEDIRPGTSAYSETLLVGNDADDDSGVMLDMFISGTDFYDGSSSGARCPTTNQLTLDAFSYYTVNGAYSSKNDGRADAEGYLPIVYGIGFNNPTPFYDNAEILQVRPQGPYWVANILAPGSKMPITFRLDLPEPCVGNFDTGSIYFWGEAI